MKFELSILSWLVILSSFWLKYKIMCIKKKDTGVSSAGNWTLVSRVKGGDTKGRVIIKRLGGGGEGYQIFKQGSQKFLTLPLNTKKKLWPSPGHR